jgi:hypothetical protein
MKHLILLSLFLATPVFAGLNSAWNIVSTPTLITANVINNSTENQICSGSYYVNIEDESGRIRGLQDITFANYIVLSRQSYTFPVKIEDMLGKEGKSFGEIGLTTAKVDCNKFQGTNEEVSLAIEGALRNSDNQAAEYFLSLAPDASSIKVINVSGSHYNLGDNFPGLNFVEIERTTYLARNTTEENKSCQERKSVKCGEAYFEKSSIACGIASYEVKSSQACGVALYRQCHSSACGKEWNGARKRCRHSRCGVERYNACASSTHGVAAYNTCRNPSHGIEDALSCPLKINSAGGFEKCKL